MNNSASRVSVVATLLTRQPDRNLTLPSWVAVLAVAATTIVYAVVAWGSETPLILLDEVNMIGNSRVIAGETPDWELRGPGFMPGLGILIAPMWWLTSSSSTVYAAGIILTCVLSLITIWPLARIIQWFGVTNTVSVVIACCVMAAPSRTFYVNYFISESLHFLCICLVLLAARRFVNRWSPTNAVVLGLSVGAVVLSHGRGVSIALAVGLWCVLMMFRRGVWVSALAAGVGVVTSLAALWLYQWCSDRLYVDDSRLEVAGDGEDRGLYEFLGSVAGQLWYLTLAWPLVAVVGAMVIVKRMRSDPAMLLLLMAVVFTFALSIQQIASSTGTNRLDTWFYGRYNDAVWTLIAAIGLALLIRVRWPLINIIAVVATAVVGALMFWVNVPRIPDDEYWQAVHVSGVAPWINTGDYTTSGNQNWLWLSVLPTVLAALFAITALVRFWLLPVVALMWTVMAVMHDIGTADVIIGERDPDADPMLQDEFRGPYRLGAVPQLGMVINTLAFNSDNDHVRVLEADDAPGQVEVLWGRFDTPEPIEDGAKVYSDASGGLYVIWIYPGELQDQLESEGRLQDLPEWLVQVEAEPAP